MVCQSIRISSSDNSADGIKEHQPDWMGIYRVEKVDDEGFPVYRKADGSGQSIFRRPTEKMEGQESYKRIWVVSWFTNA